MEYLYIAMFLNEIGREIEPANIRKVYAALNMKVDEAKVQFLISALSVLTAANSQKVKSAAEASFIKHLGSLQKQFEAVEEVMVKSHQREANEKREVTDSGKIRTSEVYATVKAIEELAYYKSSRYIYGVVDQGLTERLGNIGLDGAEVYTIPYKEMCAVVHDCPAEPYRSDDEAVVREWLFTQQEVLDIIAGKFDVVLPMSFDMIIEGKNGNNAEQSVKGWLEENYDNFLTKMTRLKNKQEFGVQIIFDTKELGEQLLATDTDLSNKRKEIDSKPEGSAYLEGEFLKELLKQKIEEKADQYFREFYNRIQECTADIVIEKTKKVGGSKQMLMNLSCLVRKDKVTELGQVLERIEQDFVVSVHFSGPWAPYSFVTLNKS